MTDGPDDAIARRALAEQCASEGHPLTREEGRPGEWWRVCPCGAERDLVSFESPSSIMRAVAKGRGVEPASPPAPVPTTPSPIWSPSRDAVARYRGSLLGLAVGDALGTTLEFSPPGTFPRITDLVGGGPFGLRPGEWTDDTAMALCLAESLIERRGFDPVDQLRRYVRWYREGHLSNTGACFDIGNTVRAALEVLDWTLGRSLSLTIQCMTEGGARREHAQADHYFPPAPAPAEG